MNQKQFVEKIKELQNIKPNSDWVNSNRDILKSQINAQVASDKYSQSNAKVLFSGIKNLALLRGPRMVFKHTTAVIIIIALVLSSGVYGVKASEKSVPGDTLYSVKLTTEKVQISLTSSEDKKAKLHIKFAGKRIQELNTLKNHPDEENKVRKITTAVEGLKKELSGVKENLDKVQKKEKKPKKIVEVANLIDTSIEEYKEILDQDIKENVKNTIEDKVVIDTVDEVIKISKEVGDEAVVAMVTNKDKEGVDKELKEEVEKKVFEKIVKLNKDIDEVKDTIASNTKEKESEIIEDTVEQDNEENKDSSNEGTDENTENKEQEDEENLEEQTEEIEDKEKESEDILNTEDEEIEEEEAVENSKTSKESIDGEKEQEVKLEPKIAESMLKEANDFAENGDFINAVVKLNETSNIVDQIKDSVKTQSEEEEKEIKAETEDQSNEEGTQEEKETVLEEQTQEDISGDNEEEKIEGEDKDGITVKEVTTEVIKEE